MTAPELIHHFGTGCAIVGSALAWLYVATYYRRNWREYEAGAHQLLFAAGLAAILTWAGYRALVAQTQFDNMTDELVRSAVYFFCAAMFGWSIRLTYKYKHPTDEEKKDV